LFFCNVSQQADHSQTNYSPDRDRETAVSFKEEAKAIPTETHSMFDDTPQQQRFSLASKSRAQSTPVQPALSFDEFPTFEATFAPVETPKAIQQGMLQKFVNL
jgi:hypothetical protein